MSKVGSQELQEKISRAETHFNELRLKSLSYKGFDESNPYNKKIVGEVSKPRNRDLEVPPTNRDRDVAPTRGGGQAPTLQKGYRDRDVAPTIARINSFVPTMRETSFATPIPGLGNKMGDGQIK
jgi:hypothetical protein